MTARFAPGPPLASPRLEGGLGLAPPGDSAPEGIKGPAALASSGARVGRAPVPGPVRDAGLRLGGPWTLIVTLAVLLPVPAASAVTTGQDKVRLQLTAPQALRRSPLTTWCPAGSHLSEYNECVNCTDGVDYTQYWNKLPSCLPCTPCKSGKEEIAPCTTTRNTQCQCKPGTYQGEQSPEFCQKCSTKCPDGMVQAKPCTPWSNLECAEPDSGNLLLKIGLPIGFLILLLVLTICACSCYYRRRILQACGVDPKRVDRVCFCHSCPLRGPGARDNAHNQIVSNRNSQSTLDSEQQPEQQKHVELADVIAQSLEEAERLLGSAEAEASPKRSRKLVPAKGTDGVESLKQFFDYFSNVVPYNSWNSLMRLLGLKDNDIHVARARALDPKEALYEMLVMWVNNVGQAASVNTLLDALETLGERNAKETIEDHLVKSGKFVYEEDGTDSAVS